MILSKKRRKTVVFNIFAEFAEKTQVDSEPLKYSHFPIFFPF